MRPVLNTSIDWKRRVGDGYGGQKGTGRFSLRFNIGDPVQRAAVELLELQPPHSKSQYIANAITYYNANFADDPQPLKAMTPVIDRAAIEAIVREIMRQETGQTEKPTPASGVCRMEEGKAASTSNVQAQKPEYIPEVGEAPEIDDVTRNLIASTMAAFRR